MVVFAYRSRTSIWCPHLGHAISRTGFASIGANWQSKQRPLPTPAPTGLPHAQRVGGYLVSARAAASRRLRFSISSALYFFVTPAARRPRDCAALFFIRFPLVRAVAVRRGWLRLSRSALDILRTAACLEKIRSTAVLSAIPAICWLAAGCRDSRQYVPGASEARASCSPLRRTKEHGLYFFSSFLPFRFVVSVVFSLP